MSAPETYPLLVGLGNAFRGDDAAGLRVARAILERCDEVDVVTNVSDGTMLLDLWTGRPECIVVDCAVSGEAAGTIHEFDGLNDVIPEHLFSSFSTHAYSIPKAIALGRTLGRLPGQLRVFGIEGSAFACGDEVTPEVGEAVETTVERILTLLSQTGRQSHATSL